MTATYYYTVAPQVLVDLHANMAAFAEFEERVAMARIALGVPDAPAMVREAAPLAQIFGFRFGPDDAIPEDWEQVEGVADVWAPTLSYEKAILDGLGYVPSPLAILVGHGMPDLVIASNAFGAPRVFKPGVKVAPANGHEALWVHWDGVNFDNLPKADQPDGAVWIRFHGKPKHTPFGGR